MPIENFHTTIRGDVHNLGKTNNSKEEHTYVLIKTKNVQQNIPYIPQIYTKIATLISTSPKYMKINKKILGFLKIEPILQ